MAGGPLAEKTACLVCLTDKGVLTLATRTYEGDENDAYRCEKGHTFSVDWSTGEADEPQWPPAQEIRDFAASTANQLKASGAKSTPSAR